MFIRFAAISILALILFFAASVESRAQNRKPTAQEIKILRDCAAKHPDDGKGEEECSFKLVAEPCIEKNGSNLGTADCYRSETAIWDEILNDNYKELLAALDDKEQEKKLKEMQRAWIAYRDTTCEFYWFKIRGSMSVPMTASCLLRETARRAFLLAFLQSV